MADQAARARLLAVIHEAERVHGRMVFENTELPELLDLLADSEAYHRLRDDVAEIHDTLRSERDDALAERDAALARAERTEARVAELDETERTCDHLRDVLRRVLDAESAAYESGGEGERTEFVPGCGHRRFDGAQVSEHLPPDLRAEAEAARRAAVSSAEAGQHRGRSAKEVKP